MLKVIFISGGTVFKLVLRMNFCWPLPVETFGLTLLEAIGSGLVMGTDVPYGNPTFIKNGRNGFLVPL